MFKFSNRFIALYSIIVTIIYTKLKYDNLESLQLTPSVALEYDGHKYLYDRDSELLFIAGFYRSGTTLFLTMVKEHPDIKCMREHNMTRLLLDDINVKWTDDQRIMYRNSVSQFILTTMIRPRTPSRIFCCKEPFLSPHMEYLKWLFPAAKFIILVRDGRGAANSAATVYHFRRYGMPELSNYEYALHNWNRFAKIMISRCFRLGGDNCMVVFYEIFVNDREFVLRDLAKFLKIEYMDWARRKRLPWKYLSPVPFEIELRDNSSLEINNGSFYNWMHNPGRVSNSRAVQLAPMLTVLGYDTKNEKPDYTMERMMKVHKMILRMQQSGRLQI